MARSTLRAAAFGLALAIGGAAPALAQDNMRQGIVQSPIVTIEVDRLYASSDFGQKTSAALDAAGATIATENRRIEAELTAEEKSLTERRRSMDPAAFRKLADAFDIKVQDLRKAQDSKARKLGNVSEERRREFISMAEPILAQLMREAGALAILDQRSVFLSAGAIDITDAAIERLNDVLDDPEPLPDFSGDDESADQPVTQAGPQKP
ncbi:OmpH family outer membrane protein [Salipiger sp. PrR002]|uniref:OmpH family outer membrane protein n=1 Tax=Salipiger sp. PrR002 TaxID=2706489 RepID=UPI0013BD38D8|nr:OmpH family outer membrane protein [Salipiger sp. PrR002]NDV99265.1 OmpH family outer membrane protein [Salipiger sp. PrR002]NDW55751.1 OmpH family outer membrane protein [Salipiger sp. PrR004]